MNNNTARDKAMEKLVEAKLRSGLIPAGADCLDAEILAAYVERTLTPRERAHCESHLASCSHCQQQVAVLVRLSDADEPAGTQVRATAPARAARISWFRWAWAGPTLAAMLVLGIYLSGPFRRLVQEVAPPAAHNQNPKANKPATPASRFEDGKSNPSSRPQSEPTLVGKTVQSREKAPVFDKNEQRHAGVASSTGAQGEPAVPGVPGGNASDQGASAQSQRDQVTQALPPSATAAPPSPAPAPQATNRVEPAPQGSIATPSVRADLAKDGRGQGAGSAGVIAPHATLGGISRMTPNKPAENTAKDDHQNGGNAPEATNPAAPKTADKETQSKKLKIREEAKAKQDDEERSSDKAEVKELDRTKPQNLPTTARSVAVQGMVLSPGKQPPVWRVGPHGLIEKLNAKGKWKKQKSGVEADLFAGAFPSADVGWAVGQGGIVLRTADGGAKWSQVASPTTDDLVQVSATSDQAAKVTTRGGRTFSTTDAGSTWSADEN